MAGMKKKDAAKWLGDMVDTLVQTEIVLTGDKATTKREAEAIACGIISALIDVKTMLEYGPYADNPSKQALTSLGDAINSYEKARRQ